MVWEDELFGLLDDLEQQAEALYDAERAPEVADRSRAEYRTVSLAARLMASVDLPVSLTVGGVGVVAGSLERVTATWCLLRGPGQDWLVALHGILTVSGASPRAVPQVAWPASARLGLASALRPLAEAGERCLVHLVDGESLEGVLGRVGEDFVELTEHSGRSSLVALGALAAVQSRD